MLNDTERAEVRAAVHLDGVDNGAYVMVFPMFNPIYQGIRLFIGKGGISETGVSFPTSAARELSGILLRLSDLIESKVKEAEMRQICTEIFDVEHGPLHLGGRKEQP